MLLIYYIKETGEEIKMKIYSVNKGIGYASSGVEYAQKYRNELFNDLNFEHYYIFLNYLSKNISVYTDLLGYKREQIIWIYNFLSDRETKESSYTIEQFLGKLPEKSYEIINKTPTNLEIKLTNSQIYKVWLLDGTMIIDRVDYIVNGLLVSVSHYDKTLNNIEDYHQGTLVKRTFFNSLGQRKFEQFYKGNEITVTFIDSKILYGQMEFYQYFFYKLNLQQDDAVIIDRPLDVVEGILPALIDKVRLFSVVHAEHYNKNLSEGSHILWNNNYEYIFQNSDSFEAIIVSTERQNKILSSQLKKKTRIITIPVGYISDISAKQTYKSHSLITASRLAPEKHIDILIKAVARARRIIPDLTLDIYGEGGQRNKLEKLIVKHDAMEFIILCGHRDLSTVYSNYSGYVSASTSEGFGLSLLEALGAGLPIIGLDVEYGNREFIENLKNGILFESEDLKSMSEKLAHAIITFYDKRLDKIGRKNSEEKAKAYLKKNVAKQWWKLLEEGGGFDGN